MHVIPGESPDACHLGVSHSNYHPRSSSNRAGEKLNGKVDIPDQKIGDSPRPCGSLHGLQLRERCEPRVPGLLFKSIDESECGAGSARRVRGVARTGSRVSNLVAIRHELAQATPIGRLGRIATGRDLPRRAPIAHACPHRALQEAGARARCICPSG